MKLPKTKMKFSCVYMISANGNERIFIKDGVVFTQTTNPEKDYDYQPTPIDTVEKAKSLIKSIEWDIQRFCRCKCEVVQNRKPYKNFLKGLSRMIEKAERER